MTARLFIRQPGTTVPDGLMFYPWCFLGSQISEVPRPIATKLCHMIGIWLRWQDKVQKLGGRSPKKYWGQKYAKFRSIFCNVRLWLRISPERRKISKSEREVLQIDSSSVLGNMSRELWSTSFRDLDVWLDPLKCTFLQCPTFSALRVCYALKFLHALETDQGYLAPGTRIPKEI